MPRVRNRTSIDGMNLRIGRTIPAHGEIEVTDAEAAVLKGSPLLDILPDPVPAAPPAPAPEQDLAAAEAELAQAQADVAAAEAASNKESN